MQFPSVTTTNFDFQGAGALLVKIPTLLLILLFILFLIMVINRLKAFDRIVHIASHRASDNLRRFAQLQLILAISLFVIALVIM